MSLDIEILKSESGKCKIELRGRLDTHTADHLDQKLGSVDASQYTVQVIDLQDLEYISSAGLRSLFRARRAATAKGGQFLIVHVQPQVQKVFDIVKALPREAIFTSLDEMDQYLDAVQRRATD